MTGERAPAFLNKSVLDFVHEQSIDSFAVSR